MEKILWHARRNAETILQILTRYLETCASPVPSIPTDFRRRPSWQGLILIFSVSQAEETFSRGIFRSAAISQAAAQGSLPSERRPRIAASRAPESLHPSGWTVFPSAGITEKTELTAADPDLQQIQRSGRPPPSSAPSSAPIRSASAQASSPFRRLCADRGGDLLVRAPGPVACLAA